VTEIHIEDATVIGNILYNSKYYSTAINLYCAFFFFPYIIAPEAVTEQICTTCKTSKYVLANNLPYRISWHGDKTQHEII
jgi:hypothetical protein